MEKIGMKYQVVCENSNGHIARIAQFVFRTEALLFIEAVKDKPIYADCSLYFTD